MSGSNGDRDSETPVTRVGGADPCKKTYRGPINSPKAAILKTQQVGSVLSVEVQFSGSVPILVVKDAAGNLAGSLTFVGYLDIIDCIQNQGANFAATIVSIAGGVYEVRVDPR